PEEPSPWDAAIARLDERIERLQQHLAPEQRDKPSASHGETPATGGGGQLGFSWARAILPVCQVVSVLGCVGSVLATLQALGQGQLWALPVGPMAFCYSVGMFLVFSHVKEARRAVQGAIIITERQATKNW